MTEKKIRYIVSRAVAATRFVSEKYYHICWWEDQVQCQYVHHTRDAHKVFYFAPGSTFRDGLSEFQWTLVTTRILEFCQSQGIELVLRSGRRKMSRRHATSRRCLTEFDSERLRILLASARTPGSELNAYLDRLQRLLETSDIVAPHDVPRDVVTMNSEVHLKDDHADHDMALSLVFPADARGSDLDKVKLSVLTRTGLSLLGRKVGDTVDGCLKILAVPYQPEAAGDFDL